VIPSFLEGYFCSRGWRDLGELSLVASRRLHQRGFSASMGSKLQTGYKQIHNAGRRLARLAVASISTSKSSRQTSACRYTMGVEGRSDPTEPPLWREDPTAAGRRL